MNTEIEKLFVPYEIALKLKDKGFNELSIAYYEEGYDIFNFGLTKGQLYNNDRFLISAPLYQQVIDWLNTKHNIDVSIFQLSKTQSAYGITFLECYPERYNEDDMYEYTNTTAIMNQIVLEEKRNIKIPSAAEIAKENYSKYEATNKAIEQALNLIK